MKALITGASGGMGAIYADRLARRGCDLILVARNRDRLNAVGDRIRRLHGRSVETVLADLGQPDDLWRVEAILRDDAAIGMLVNNAGFDGVAPLVQADVDTMESMIAVNVTALMRLSYAAAPAFVARGGGSIINISSIVAIAPELLNGVYGGTKAFVLAFSQSLHHELSAKGLRVQSVLPGATATEFWDVAGLGGSGQLPSAWVMPAEDMVDAALRGFDAGELVTIPSLQEEGEWNAYEAARQVMSGHLSNARPAARYLPG